MIKKDDGHVYELANVVEGVQTVTFIKKGLVLEDSKELEVKFDGTTNEEVFAMMIDRVTSLQALLPCDENVQVIDLLNQIVAINDKRTADRQERKVEGTHEA